MRAVFLVPCASCIAAEPPPATPSDTGGALACDVTDTGTATEHTGLVSVTLSVTEAGADCYTRETLELPARYWWAYARDADTTCNAMTWEAVTDDGDCWGFSTRCYQVTELDPYIYREPDEPGVTAWCAERDCSTR